MTNREPRPQTHTSSALATNRLVSPLETIASESVGLT
jgi:hypothetical protein